MQNLITAGGPVMYPIFLCSVILIYVILERTIFFLRIFNCDLLEFFKISSEKYLSFDKEKRDLYLLSKLKSVYSNLKVLEFIGGISPLLGILGTVIGIIYSFNILSSSGIKAPHEVVKGIAQALITTAAGLSVSIVALFFYFLFSYFSEKIVLKVETELNDIS